MSANTSNLNNWRMKRLKLSLIAGLSLGLNVAHAQQAPVKESEIGNSDVLIQAAHVVGKRSAEKAEVWSRNELQLGLINAFKTTGERKGLDPAFLMTLAYFESSFDPGSSADQSSAQGLFQHTIDNWLNNVQRYGSSYGLARLSNAIDRDHKGAFIVTKPHLTGTILRLRNDPLIAIAITAEDVLRRKQKFKDSLGYDPDDTLTYFSFLLGEAGADRFARLLATNPTQRVDRAFGSLVRNNRNRFIGSSGEFLTIRGSYEQMKVRFEAREVRYSYLLDRGPARVLAEMRAGNNEPVEVAMLMETDKDRVSAKHPHPQAKNSDERSTASTSKTSAHESHITREHIRVREVTREEHKHESRGMGRKH